MAGKRFTLSRIYDDDQPAGVRVLVDRMWPRGVSKEAAALDEWLKDAAPGSELRKWYGHVVDRFDEFSRRYRAELEEPPGSEAVAHLRDLAVDRPVVLLTATKDVAHSGAQVLLEVLVSGS